MVAVSFRNPDVARAGADLCVAVGVTWTWVLYGLVNTCAHARIEHMVDFTATRPYVTRALVPLLIRAGEHVLPDVTPLRGVPLFDATLLAFTGPFYPTPPRQAVLVFVIATVFVLVAIRAGRGLVRVEHRALGPGMRSLLAWSIALSLLVFMCARNTYGRQFVTMIYDPATLGLMTLALAALAVRQWWGFVAVVAVSATNRETTLYLLPVFCLFAWPRMERWTFAVVLASCAGAFIAIRGALHMATAHLPLFDVPIRLAVTPPEKFIPAGIEAPIAIAFAALFVAARLTARGLSLAALVIVPCSIVGYLLAGEPGEYRVFTETGPVVALSGGSLASWMLAGLYRLAPRVTAGA